MTASNTSRKGRAVSTQSVDAAISICEGIYQQLCSIMGTYECIHYFPDEGKLIITKLLSILNERFIERLNWEESGSRDRRVEAAYNLRIGSSGKVFFDGYARESVECADFYLRESLDYGCTFTGENLHKLRSWDSFYIYVYPDMEDIEDTKASTWIEKHMENYIQDDPDIMALSIYKDICNVVQASLDGYEDYAEVSLYRNKDIVLLENYFKEDNNTTYDPYLSKAFDLIGRLKTCAIDDMGQFVETSNYAYVALFKGEDGFSCKGYYDECFIPYYWYIAYEFEVIADYLDSKYHFREEKAGEYRKTA